MGLDNCGRTTKNAPCHIYSLWRKQQQEDEMIDSAAVSKHKSKTIRSGWSTYAKSKINPVYFLNHQMSPLLVHYIVQYKVNRVR
jgi:hypothetical protein